MTRKYSAELRIFRICTRGQGVWERKSPSACTKSKKKLSTSRSPVKFSSRNPAGVYTVFEKEVTKVSLDAAV